jgi:hypothetical protein
LIVASMVSPRPRLTFSDSGTFPITAVPILECRSADPATPDPLIVIEQGTNFTQYAVAQRYRGSLECSVIRERTAASPVAGDSPLRA